MTLITRSGKGSKLTASEMDSNLLYLEQLTTGASPSILDYISSVNAGNGLTGGGLSGDVTLSILTDGITEDMLNIIGGPTAGYILSNDGTNLTWIESNPGDITSVIAGTGLTGGGLSGDVTLDIDSNYVALQSDLSDYLSIVDGGTISNEVYFSYGDYSNSIYNNAIDILDISNNKSIGIDGINQNFYYNNGTFSTYLKFEEPTNNVNIYLPNISGTVSLTSDFGQLSHYDSGSLPTAATNIGKLIYISDTFETAYSDGTNWMVLATSSSYPG